MARKNPLQLEIYEAAGGWRWRMFRSGRSVAESPKPYAKRAQCRRTLTRLIVDLGREDYIWKLPPSSLKGTKVADADEDGRHE